jgi:hypothetical protein
VQASSTAHVDCAAPPFVADNALGFGQHLLADTAALLAGVGSEHAEVTGFPAAPDMASGLEPAVAFSHEHPAALARDDGGNIGGASRAKCEVG